MKLDKALSKYTDELNSNTEIDLEKYRQKMSISDYKEFLQLIQFVRICKSVDKNQDFDKIFEELNKYKEDYYNQKSLRYKYNISEHTKPLGSKIEDLEPKKVSINNNNNNKIEN